MITTVLVGNGPSALKKPLGKEIDAFETVIRFNTFRLRGFESCVGRRTTIWAVNLGYIVMPQTTDIHWRADYPRPRTICFVPWTLDLFPNYAAVSKMYLPENTEMCEERVAREADQFYRGDTWASTGLMAILQFKPCAIVGFDCFMDTRHHYGDDSVGAWHHEGNTELDFIEEQVKNGSIVRL